MTMSLEPDGDVVRIRTGWCRRARVPCRTMTDDASGDLPQLGHISLPPDAAVSFAWERNQGGWFRDFSTEPAHVEGAGVAVFIWGRQQTFEGSLEGCVRRVVVAITEAGMHEAQLSSEQARELARLLAQAAERVTDHG